MSRLYRLLTVSGCLAGLAVAMGSGRPRVDDAPNCAASSPSEALFVGAEIGFKLVATREDDSKVVAVLVKTRDADKRGCLAEIASDSRTVSRRIVMDDDLLGRLGELAVELRKLRISPFVESPLVLDGYAFELWTARDQDRAHYSFVGTPGDEDAGALWDWARQVVELDEIVLGREAHPE